MSGKRGFSAIETFMVTNLLLLVSIPMVLSLNAQNRELRRSDSLTAGNLAVEKLFDVVDPNIPLVNRDNMVVGCENSTGVWRCQTQASVFCDPLSPSQDLGRCEQGPFFFRRYALNPIDNKLTIEVGVANRAGLGPGEGNLTIYRRRYELNSYRIYPRTNNNPLVAADPLGQAWYQESFNNTPENSPMSLTDLGAGCTAPSEQEGNSITHRYVTRISSSCQPRYRFKVEPGVNYSLSLYFTNRTDPGLCSAGNDDRTRHSININVTDMDNNLISSKRNIDIGAKVNRRQNGQTSESLYFRVPPGGVGVAGVREIAVRPEPSGGCTGTYGELSAIELNQL
jgi:hypothetical protein